MLKVLLALMSLSFVQAGKKTTNQYEAVILELTGLSEATMSQQFKDGLYYPIVDAFVVELNQRSSETLEIMRAIRACSPVCSVTHHLIATVQIVSL